MPWHSTSPTGSISVKANRTPMQQNTTYIEDTMGISPVGTNTVVTRDHFWKVGSDEDGRHRFIQSPAFTVGGNPTDPVIGTGMDCVEYPKTVAGRVERFHRNAQGIYQHVPSFLQGTVNLSNTTGYFMVSAVPINVYGEIIMWTAIAGIDVAQTGFFKSNGTLCQSWSLALLSEDGTPRGNLRFGNGTNAAGLNIRVKVDSLFPVGTGTWNYRITYRAI